MLPKTCKKCCDNLVAGDNWTDALQRQNSYLCRGCNSAKGKAWAKANPQKMRDAQNTRRRADPEAYRQKKSAYYQANKAKWREYHRNWREVRRSDPLRRAKATITYTRIRAKRMGLPFDLTAEFLAEKFTSGLCEATGVPLVFTDGTQGRKKIHPHAPSLDRLKPELGYVQSNVRVVTYIYNLAKSEFTDAEVLELARAVVARAAA